MDAYILALETSSHMCEVALLSSRNGKIDVCMTSHDAVGEHAERLLPMVDGLLNEAGLDRSNLDVVAFGQGPGGFTGLRVACGVAQGIAFALNIPVVPVVSLHAAAACDARAYSADNPQAEQPIRVLLQDARMQEVYLGAYLYVPQAGSSDGEWHVLQAPILLNATDVSAWLAQTRPAWRDGNGQPLPLRLLGDGLDAYPQIQAMMTTNGLADVRRGPPTRASADSIARMALDAWQHGQAIAADQAAPLYVRDKVAYTTQEREQGQGGNPKAATFASIAIEPMTVSHLDLVLDIERSVQSFPWSRQNFQDALQAGYGAWEARHVETTFGFYLAMYAPDVTHLLLIAVAPQAQRRGVGAALLSHCERESLARGLERIILEVRPSNRKALGFYAKHGFATLSTRKDYYPTGRGKREDALVLEKLLIDGGAP